MFPQSCFAEHVDFFVLKQCIMFVVNHLCWFKKQKRSEWLQYILKIFIYCKSIPSDSFSLFDNNADFSQIKNKQKKPLSFSWTSFLQSGSSLLPLPKIHLFKQFTCYLTASHNPNLTIPVDENGKQY